MNTAQSTNNQETRYIVNLESFEKYGCMQTYTYYREDGIEVAGYTSNTVLNGDGVRAGSDLPVDVYLSYLKSEAGSDNIVVWSEAEFNKKTAEKLEKRKEEQGEISEETYWWRYGCMPPCQYNLHSDIEFFHMAERITADLVTWNALIGNNAYYLVDEAKADVTHIKSRFIKLHKQLRVTN
ncbi:hypothetical protein LCS82_07625 [Vibrio harveyi]|uniref:hypothetical protein n=1 Tax=Vibrio harveyi TaxID=669 RepID=UPI003BB5ABAC